MLGTRRHSRTPQLTPDIIGEPRGAAFLTTPASLSGPTSFSLMFNCNTVGTIQMNRLENLDYKGLIFILIQVREKCHIIKVHHISLKVCMPHRARVKPSQDSMCQKAIMHPQSVLHVQKDIAHVRGKYTCPQEKKTCL